MPFTLTSPAFREGEPIPKKYTGDGDDISPPLQWTDAPDGTESFVLICDDPDAPNKTWVHWVLFNLTKEAQQLPEGVPTEREVPEGAKQGQNDFGNLGYGGPAPPPGHGTHHYYFKLYALNGNLALEPGCTKTDVLKAMEDQILGEARIMGTYERRK